jgi:hypothetical protein
VRIIRRRREAAERRRGISWPTVVVLLLVGWCAVDMLWMAASVLTTEECPTVVDKDGGRWLDLECAPSDGMPKGVAVLISAAFGLVFGTVALLLLLAVVSDVRRSRKGRRAA